MLLCSQIQAMCDPFFAFFFVFFFVFFAFFFAFSSAFSSAFLTTPRFLSSDAAFPSTNGVEALWLNMCAMRATAKPASSPRPLASYLHRTTFVIVSSEVGVGTLRTCAANSGEKGSPRSIHPRFSTAASTKPAETEQYAPHFATQAS
jgi:hypothetical protein